MIAALALSRVMASLLFGITATDPLTFAGVALLPVIVAFVACFQTNGALSGRVITTENNSATGISIKIEETGQTTTTDTAGRFSFGNLAPGKYTLTVSGGGFVPQTRDVELASGQTATAEFSLEKISASMDVVASLKEYHLEESGVATRVNTRLIDVPVSVQVFPNQLIEDRAILEGNELFRNVSGLNQNNYSAMTFRGFTQREILYNGTRGNPFGSLVSTSQIRLTNIQRVEVLSGFDEFARGGESALQSE
jgi:outer membrane receptor for ferric coprogen and ferric-rhodotorulic acid